jgi:outer membrane biosynthesis protein TonB
MPLPAPYGAGLTHMDPQKLVDQVAQNVREAIDEAQRQAEEILGEAEAQAKRVRAEAEKYRAEAERIRADAESEARRRLDAVQSALTDLQGRLSSTPGSEVNPGPVTVPEPEPPQTPEPLPDPTPEPTPERVPEPMPEPVPEPTPPPETPQTPEPVSSSPATANGDEAAAGDDSAARLVAMKLALDGTSREAAKEQLAAEYDLADLDSLLDDVYSRAAK